MQALLSAILFFLPFQTQWILRGGQLRGQPWEYGTIGIFAVDILIAVVVAWELFLHDRWPAIRSLGVGWWIAALVLQIFFSIIPALDKGVAFLHTLWVIEAIVLAWLIARAPNRSLLMSAFVAGSVAQAVLGLWQFFTQSTFASTVLGFALHPAWKGGTSVIEIAGTALRSLGEGGERWLRAYAGLPHPNVFGGWMAVALIMALHLVVQEARPRVRAGLLAVIPLLSSGLAVSFSRSAWIAAGVGVVAFVIARESQRPKQSTALDSGLLRYARNDVVAIAIIILSIVAILLPYRSLLQTRIESTARLEQLSITQRRTQYAQAWEMIRQQRWCRRCAGANGGIAGIGNYTLAVSNANPNTPVWNIQPVHNVFLLMGAELHPLSLIWLLLVLYFNFKRALGITEFSSFHRHILRRLQDSESALPVALFAAMVLLLFLDHYLWSLHVGLLLWGVILGFALQRSRPSVPP